MIIKQLLPPTITPPVLGRLAHPGLHTLAHALPGRARPGCRRQAAGAGRPDRAWGRRGSAAGGPDANTMRAVEESPRRAAAGPRRKAW